MFNLKFKAIHCINSQSVLSFVLFSKYILDMSVFQINILNQMNNYSYFIRNTFYSMPFQLISNQKSVK